MDNVPHKDIRLPLTTGKSTANASDYKGKVFVDEGGITEDGGVMEKGEFVVDSVSSDNNFLCIRLGGTQEPQLFDMCYAIQGIRKYEEQ